VRRADGVRCRQLVRTRLSFATSHFLLTVAGQIEAALNRLAVPQCLRSANPEPAFCFQIFVGEPFEALGPITKTSKAAAHPAILPRPSAPRRAPDMMRG
jgi:hypothetical protein